MPTVGQLLLIVVALAAPADMTIMCVELSGDPNLPRTMIAVTVDAINAALCSTNHLVVQRHSSVPLLPWRNILPSPILNQALAIGPWKWEQDSTILKSAYSRN